MTFLLRQILKKDREVLEKALARITGMRDTWKEIMFKTKEWNQCVKFLQYVIKCIVSCFE